MSLLENIHRLNYSSEDVAKLLKLYEYKGKDFYFQDALDADADKIKKEIIEKDTLSMCHLFKINIPDKKIKLLFSKKTKARTKEENLVKNIYSVLEIASKNGANFDLETNEVIDLVGKLFKNIKKIPLTSVDEPYQENLIVLYRKVSSRDKLDSLFEKYKQLLDTEQYEIISLIVNFYIDFINIKPFEEYNEIIALFVLHNMLLREKFIINLFESFFDMIYKNYEAMNKYTAEASYNYNEGYAHTEHLTGLIIDILITNYKTLDRFVNEYEYDVKIKKSDNIENTIMKMQQTFTKADIRKIHPFVSDSTIDRTLKRLRDLGKISPLGTGRSASWIRIAVDEEEYELNGQISIYQLGEANE